MQLDQQFLTTSEAAEFLRLSRKTLESWRWQGRGPKFRRFGRRKLYSLADLRHWADLQAVSSTADPGPGAGQ